MRKNENAKFLSKKFDELLAEFNDKNMRELKSRRKQRHKEVSTLNLDFKQDPGHRYRVNKSYFANPMFSTLKKQTQRGSYSTKRRYTIESPIRIGKSERRTIRRRTQLHGAADYDDMLLTKRIMQGERLRSVIHTEQVQFDQSQETEQEIRRRKFNQSTRVPKLRMKTHFGGVTKLNHTGYGIRKLMVSTKPTS